MGDAIAKILAGLGQGASIMGDFANMRERQKLAIQDREDRAAYREAQKQDALERQQQNMKWRQYAALTRGAKLTPEQSLQLMEHLGLAPEDEMLDVAGADTSGLDPNATKAFEGVAYDASGKQTMGGSSSIRSLIRSFGGGGRGKRRGGSKEAPFFNYDPDTGKTETYDIPKDMRPAVTAVLSQHKMGAPEKAERKQKITDFLNPKRTVYKGEEDADIIDRMNRLKDAPTQFADLEAESARRSPQNIIKSLMDAAQQKGLVKPPTGAPAAPPPTAQPDPQDLQALDWLKQNPNDPNAGIVIQKLKSKGLL